MKYLFDKRSLFRDKWPEFIFFKNIHSSVSIFLRDVDRFVVGHFSQDSLTGEPQAETETVKNDK